MDSRRNGPRQRLKYRAFIEGADESPPMAIELMDISSSGARLKVENADAIPSSFVLLLTASNGPQRKCRVVWRKETELGVEFLREPHEK